MKLLDIAEAKRHPDHALQEMIMAALGEIGSKVKFDKVISWPDELVRQTVGMMKEAKSNPDQGSYMSIILPLDQIVLGLKKVQDSPLSDAMHGLFKLVKNGHFMHADMNTQYQRQLVSVMRMKTELLPHCQHLSNCARAIHVLIEASQSDDDYKRSISTAVLKNIGLISKETP